MVSLVSLSVFIHKQINRKLAFTLPIDEVHDIESCPHSGYGLLALQSRGLLIENGDKSVIRSVYTE